MQPDTEALPRDRSEHAFSEGRLERAHDREIRMAQLFRRWPDLSSFEEGELKRLWRRRVAVASRRRTN
jgi:hypothetical protein